MYVPQHNRTGFRNRAFTTVCILMAKFQFGKCKMAHSVTSPRITLARVETWKEGSVSLQVRL